MPGMDGVEFIGHVAQGRLARGIALVSAMDPALLAAVQAMARAYGLAVLASIVKPLTVEKLRTLMIKWDAWQHGDEPDELDEGLVGERGHGIDLKRGV